MSIPAMRILKYREAERLEAEIAEENTQANRACLHLLKECGLLVLLPLAVAYGTFFVATEAPVVLELACNGFSMFTARVLALSILTFPIEWCPVYSGDSIHQHNVFFATLGLMGSFLYRNELFARLKEIPARFTQARDELHQRDAKQAQLYEQLKHARQIEHLPQLPVPMQFPNRSRSQGSRLRAFSE